MCSAQAKIRRARDLFKRRKKAYQKHPSSSSDANPIWRQALRLARNVTRNTEDLSPQQHKEREIMRKMLLTIALTVVAPFAWGQGHYCQGYGQEHFSHYFPFF